MMIKKTIMKTFTAMASVAVLLLFTCCAGKKAVTFDQLPATLQTLVNEHFRGKDLAYATLDREDMGKKYELVLSDGTEIEADGKGNWREIKCNTGNTVPSGVIPQQINSYVSAKHAQVGIRKIEKKKKGYEIELSNGLEIKFDNNFVVTGYDS